MAQEPGSGIVVPTESVLAASARQREGLARLSEHISVARRPLQPLGEVAIDPVEVADISAIYSGYGRELDGLGNFIANAIPRRAARARQVQALEAFLNRWPNGAYAPSVCRELAHTYLDNLGYQAADRNFTSAYNKTRLRSEPLAREIAADAALEHARILQFTGDFKNFDDFLLQERARDPQSVAAWWQIREQRNWNQRYPADSFKCGLIGLDQLAQLLKPEGYDSMHIFNRRGDSSGYDAAQLVKIGQEIGLGTRAIQFATGGQLPVPSIIHLGIGHYVTVRRYDAGLYEVMDPTVPIRLRAKTNS